jgi:hypothetical protein
LQEIVWNITNGDGMTEEDKEYIDSLPDLPAGVYPDGIYVEGFDLPASWCAGCGLETAWGGAYPGEGNAWWFYYDARDGAGGEQEIYSGKDIAAGASVEYDNGKIIIKLGSSLQLVDVPEAVKIQGYNDGDLPTSRPAAGQFTTYKGKNLTVTVDKFDYYAIHLDVVDCHRSDN